MSGMKAREEHGAHLFKLIQVGLALERPQPGHIVRQFELLVWLPVLDKTTFICGDDAVVPVAVLPQGIRTQSSEPLQEGNARSSNEPGTDGAFPPSPTVYHPHGHHIVGWYRNFVLS